MSTIIPEHYEQQFWRVLRSPMLAMPPNKFFDTDQYTPTEMIGVLEAWGYLFDMKWDGVRVVAYCGPGGVSLRNRNGVDINHRYPDVVSTLVEVTKDYGEVALDGEIVVFNADGKPDFGLVARRDRVKSEAKALQAMKKLPATFVAFDLLALNGDDLMPASFVARRAMLEAHFSERIPLFTLSVVSTQGAAMWEMVQAYGLEGLIAKNPESRYANGSRSDGWIKVKDLQRITAIVTGMQDGTGKHKGKMGALLLGLYDANGDIVDIGKVGTGFSDQDREDYQKLIPAYGPDALAMGALMVEVEYLNVTDDGVLRFPSYKGARNDLDPGDCTTDQLNTDQLTIK